MGKKMRTDAEYYTVDPGTVVAVKPSDLCVMEVGAIARRLGYGGNTFGEMAGTWLKKVVENGGAKSKDDGLKMAYRAMNFLGGMIEGKMSRQALGEAGMTWGMLTALMDSCEEFEKVVVAVYQIRKRMSALKKESIGEEVLETAYDLAVNGEDQYNRLTGENLHFKKKSEKMLDRLLALSGKEFGSGLPSKDAGGEKPSVALTFNFGGVSQKMEVVDVG